MKVEGIEHDGEIYFKGDDLVVLFMLNQALETKRGNLEVADFMGKLALQFTDKVLEAESEKNSIKTP